MEKPDFNEIGTTLLEYSNNLKENSQIGNSKLILTFAEMIRVMAWQGDQQEATNSKISNLISGLQLLRTSIDKANLNSEKLDQANYRLQLVMVTLTAIGTLIIVFPILKIAIEWLISNFSSLSIPIAVINIIAALASMLSAFITSRKLWNAGKNLKK